MAENFKIALDAMGGDDSPKKVIDGAALALEKFPTLEYLLVGDQDQIKPLLDSHPELAKNSEIRHTTEVVLSEDKPAMALRKRKNSSMSLAIKAVADGEASCVVSAGNTGALMAMALFGLKPLPNISRPAIASYYPTKVAGKRTVLMDLGANIQCSAKHLSEFAVLGGTFAQVILKQEQPKIAILNVGSEDMKGNDAVQEASSLLSEMVLPGEFAGFAEGDDIMSGKFDVVVTDGFTGNIALKTSEGTASLMSDMMKKAFSGSLLARLAYPLMIPALNKLKAEMDPRRYNGGVFMGLRGLCVKSHGGMDEVGFASAIKVGAKMILGDINKHLADALEKNALLDKGENVA